MSQAQLPPDTPIRPSNRCDSSSRSGRGDPVTRYYLATTLHAVAEQCRSVTREDVLVITTPHQLAICEDAAIRILDLDTDDEELNRGAERLLAEVNAGRRWRWRQPVVAEGLAVSIVVFGVAGVVTGGLGGSVALVVASIVLGAVLLFLVVLRYRRQVWQIRADELALLIEKHGVA